MRPLLRLLLAPFISCLLTTCAQLSDVRVISRNFEDEVDRTQNLVFTFNKDLIPKGRLDEWDSVPYIRFEPTIPGKFKWTAENELVFSPAIALSPATNYQAKLTNALVRQNANGDYTITNEPIGFHTPYLQLTDTELWWTRSRETGRPIAKAKLTFNYPVSGIELARLLKVRTDHVLITQIAQNTLDKSVPLTLTNAPSTKTQQPLNVRIEKGLKVPNTTFVTSEAFESTPELPSPYKLDVIDVKTGFENNEGVIRIITTQELQPSQLADYYTITPQIEARTELTENGLTIRGNFNETDTYVLTLTNHMKGVLGTHLEEPVSRDLFFGKMPAGISFANKRALYLSSKGSKNIGVNITNVPKVQVKIARLYENNILHYVKTGRYEDYGEIEGEWKPVGSYTYNDDNEGLADIIVNKTVETANLPKVQGVSALSLSLPDQSSSGKENLRGIYLVTVSSKEEAYLNATKMVSISDIGLIIKQSNDDVWVFANSIKTAESLSNVNVTLVGRNNQPIAELTTNGKGVAHFEKLNEKASDNEPALVTARLSNDFNYLLLQDTRVETSRFDVEGKRDNPTGFDAFLYGDRDIYRPGETIHFNTVIRTPVWESPGEIPLKIRIISPNGKDYRVLRKITNEQGAVETSVTIDPAAVTGTYVLEVYNANETLLTSRPISVEEFIPDRIKVDVHTERDAYRTGETITLQATATNLFGPPAIGRPYEMDLQLRPKMFSAKGFPEYTFSISTHTSFEKDLRQGITDAKGQATERFPISAAYRDIGLLEGKLYVTVFDENSRPVNRLKQLEIVTQETFYGLHLTDTYVSTNVPLPVEVVAVDGHGNLQRNAIAQIEVVRFDYQTVIEKQHDQLRYTSKKRERIVYTNTLPFHNKKYQFRYVPTVSGEYEVRVRRPGSLTYTAVPFYAYGYGSTQSSSFEVSTEGRILMEFDKPHYQIGDQAKVLFKAPFAGKLLVTIERNKVLETQVLETDNKSAELTLKLTDEYLPTVYVTATLIRPLAGSTVPLTVAHGFAPLSIEAPKTKLPVHISAVAQSRSKTKQRIIVKTEPNAELTVAVVDEGILQLKNFQTPDIHRFFYQKRALEVTSHDLYAFLFPELSITGTSSSGGDGYKLGKRINPLSNSRVNLVTFWSGPLKANSRGEATFDVAIPQFSGDLRVMAVAYKGNAFGSNTTHMKVADPLVISTGAPRFLSPNDELSLPVTISNTTTVAATVTASLKTSGMVKVVGKMDQTLTILPGQEARATFSVKAQPAMGPSRITVAVRGLNETFVETTNLTVRPPTSLLKTAQSGVVATNGSQVINLTHSFIPSSVRSQLIVSRSPMVQLTKELSYLLGYPYGCIEQTISRAFPQLYFADVIKTIGKPNTYFVSRGESDLNPSFTVQEAIRRVESMQLFNGGFSMWPSSSTEDPWATAYAVHFLTEAERAGFEVNPATYSKAIDRLNIRTGIPTSEEEVHYDEAGNRTVRKIASRQDLYALYVLALSGQPNRPAMNYYKQNSRLLTTDSHYLLASTFYLIGDIPSYRALLPNRFATTTIRRQSGGSYASPIRNLALVLNTLLETDANNLQIPTLARQLSQVLNGTPYLTTQESVFAILALGKIARKAATSVATATLSSNGKLLAKFTGKDLKLTNDLTNRTIALKATGKGSLYWFTQTEGLSATGRYTQEDAGLRVRREFLNRNGIPLSTFRQNDLVVVRISLSSKNEIPVDNVVITDMLPAGFEIENPRLTESREMPWIKDATKPEHFDVRDDRIHFFTSVGKKQKTMYYLARIVSKGTFILGPVSADAMYDSNLRSYSGGGSVSIE